LCSQLKTATPQQKQRRAARTPLRLGRNYLFALRYRISFRRRTAQKQRERADARTLFYALLIYETRSFSTR
jgi:hypothetical protein